jgi:hypothetical protein
VIFSELYVHFFAAAQQPPKFEDALPRDDHLLLREPGAIQWPGQ